MYIAKALWQNALLFHEAGTWDVIVKFNVVCWDIYAQVRIDVYSPDTASEMPFSSNINIQIVCLRWVLQSSLQSAAGRL